MCRCCSVDWNHLWDASLEAQSPSATSWQAIHCERELTHENVICLSFRDPTSRATTSALPAPSAKAPADEDTPGIDPLAAAAQVEGRKKATHSTGRVHKKISPGTADHGFLKPTN